ncbi:MAG: nucleotidyltransferase family protein [candidate division WOR-3 bacterium]
MKFLILAGGYGKRFRRVLTNTPKPMAPVGNLPFLEYMIYQISSQGFKDIILCVGYKGDEIINYFKDGRHWSVTIDYSMEKKPLGTAGAIKLASSRFNDQNFIVMNDDSMLGLDFQELISFHMMNNAKATIALVKVNDVKRFGRVVLKRDGTIENFIEKNSSGQGYINAGVYILNREILNLIPEGKRYSLEKKVFPRLRGKGLYGRYFNDAFFIDIGLPESYLQVKDQPERLHSVINIHRKEKFRDNQGKGTIED